METFKLTIHLKKTRDHFFPCNTNIDILHFYQSNPISINNENLHYEHNFTYLGIEIDYLLTMKPTCDQIDINASHKLYIYRLISG